MVLNPALYNALVRRFGTVKIVDEGIPFKFRVVTDPKTKRKKIERLGNHEQYVVCCPICGDDKPRLNISHAWLTKPSRECPMLTHNAYCYNETCDVSNFEFYRQFLGEVGKFAEIPLMKPPPEKPRLPCRLPHGLIPLHQLPSEHPAIQFLRKKYNGLDPTYLSLGYGAAYASQRDELYRMAYDRIVFPIYEKGELVAWQGRRIDNDVNQKWILSPGFRRTYYNADRILAHQIPIICEGITSAISTGPCGTAIFNKVIDDRLAKEAASRWATAIVITDPETFVPDMRTEKRNINGKITAPAKEYAKELCALLNKHMKIPVYAFRWPEPILALARDKVRGHEVKVPDPADLGMVEMRKLLLAQVPATHRSFL